MIVLNSIQTADWIFETNTRPVLVMCEDRNDYVCKYHNYVGSANRLFCEYLAASFLKLWNLKIPDYAFVKINREHIPQEWEINSYYFDTTCFGLKYNRAYKDVTKVNEAIRYRQRGLYSNKIDLLKIGLFDIWVANEDRNHNNYNLLIDVGNERNFVPIDHEAIFNTQDFNNSIYQINEFESLICTTLVLNMFNNQYFSMKVHTELEKYFYLCIENCREKIGEILDNVPPDWKIDRDGMLVKIEQIFTDDWIHESFNQFLSFLQHNQKKY
jgi:hypothetical protein